MKKNIGILGIIILFVCLFMCIIIMKFIRVENKILECDFIDYNNLVLEINTATNNLFMIKETIPSHIPLSFSSGTDYMLAINEQNEEEYFIIVKNISELDFEELENLKNIVNAQNSSKKLKINETDIYTYFISSEEFLSTIDGIIRSCIYCN